MSDFQFADFGFAEPIDRALKAAEFNTPTPIQVQAIPPALDGADIMGIAQTGTGKTAAFALPLLQHLLDDGAKAHPKRPRALILAPTRELALQIDAAIRSFAKFLNIRHGVVIGGVGQHPQVKALNRGLDILTACPGRLMDLMNQRCVDLSEVEYLVLDEADRMLDMGFVRDVRKIVAQTHPERMTHFFSATTTADVEKLAGEMLHDPVRISVTPASVPVEKIDQRIVFVEGAEKRGLLSEMLGDAALSRVIVFTRTKHGANRLAEQLDKDGISADALHGNKSQSAREKALARFRRGQARVLVATDIAARGIDVDGVSHVVNFDLPMEPEAYVHRIGRTARAGLEGIAVSFVSRSEFGLLNDIEKLLKRQIADPANDPRGEADRRLDGRAARKQNGGGGGNRGQGRPNNRGPKADGPKKAGGKPKRFGGPKGGGSRGGRRAA